MSFLNWKEFYKEIILLPGDGGQDEFPPVEM